MEDFYRCAFWELRRVIWPHRCLITNHRLCPGTLAYRGRAVWMGPGDPVLEEHWHHPHQHMMWLLKE